MYFQDSFLEQITNSLLVSQVVGRKVSLKQKGREHLGLCPFHSEKTPSFTVNNDKGFYHCFGCGEHGNVFDFIKKTQGLNFKDTVIHLAGIAGLRLPEGEEESDANKMLYSICHESTEWFHKNLLSNKKAMKYLSNRGVDLESIKHFKIGYAPESGNGLSKSSAVDRKKRDVFEELQLIRKSKDGGYFYDYFRGRIMFPIHNISSRIIAFGGRVLDNNEKPKYLNSPESVLFDKSAVLYNAHNAKQHIYSEKRLIVVEGYLDVIKLSQAGFCAVVAPLGTALTMQHINLLWSLHSVPTICFDRDVAGEKAMLRAILMAIQYVSSKKSLKFVLLPKGKDPDDVVTEHGSAGLSTLLEESMTISEMVWHICTSEFSKNSAEDYADLEARIMDYFSQVKDTSLRLHYFTFLRNKIKEMRWKRGFRDSKTAKNIESDEGNVADFQKKDVVGELALCIVMLFPDILDFGNVEEELALLQIDNSSMSSIRDEILAMKSLDRLGDVDSINAALSKMGYGADVGKISEAVWKYGVKDFDTAKELWKRVVSKYQIDMLEKEYRVALEEQVLYAKDNDDLVNVLRENLRKMRGAYSVNTDEL